MPYNLKPSDYLLTRDDECVGSAVSFSAQTDETPVHWCWIDTPTHVNFIW